jgi:hypothetical protein
MMQKKAIVAATATTTVTVLAILFRDIDQFLCAILFNVAAMWQQVNKEAAQVPLLYLIYHTELM